MGNRIIQIPRKHATQRVYGYARARTKFPESFPAHCLSLRMTGGSLNGRQYDEVGIDTLRLAQFSFGVTGSRHKRRRRQGALIKSA